ncbi:hypothetical protein E1A91_A12G108300v1 [Gossypium mustelinum]|uniref:Uncharacterized protein n=1 Tax=Gossypium mustelinum TaxID=34275 RepID=A0A5D2WST3_GOSMU|nr:hypothetical protein E1A91_A12G108300v1 [Gossypium mustelinum]
MSHSQEFYTKGKYKIIYGMRNEFTICYNETKPIVNNYWQSVNPMMKTLPIFLLQLSVVIAIGRVFMIVLRPLRQPRFLSQLLAGVLLGPGALGISGRVANDLTPFEGSMFLETMANLGVTFYMFLVRLEMDLTPIKKMGKPALSVAISGMLLPLAAGVELHSMALQRQTVRAPEMGAYFWSIALTLTSFPDLARMLSDLKLMYTDLGKTALTAAVVNDLSCWCLLVVAVSLINGEKELYVAIPVLVGMTIFWFSLRPLIRKILRYISATSKEATTSDKHIYFILSLVFLSGFVTELCGAHSIFGAFMFGLMIPGGELGTTIMDKVEEFVVGILLPPIFLITGTRTNIQYIFADYSVGLVIAVVLLASSAKIISVLLVCLYLKCSVRDGLALGVLMNTKGVLALIILNEGRNMKGFDQQTFSWIVVAIAFMTAIIGPIVSYTHKSERHLKYMDRHLKKCKTEAPIRILACVHSTRNLSAMITLLEISNATRKSPIIVFAVHLVELAGRASAMLIFHDKDKTADTGHTCSREKAEAEQIVSAFESFVDNNHGATVKPLTAVSPYTTMHEDLVNQNLLATSPCSIGLLVDRGLTSFAESQKGTQQECRIAMLFVEGTDDREALAYAWRMAGTPSVTLSVIRFVPGKEGSEFIENSGDNEEEPDIFTAMFERETQKQLDDDYINQFRFKTMHDQSIAYVEIQVNSGDQIVSAISSEFYDFDLYVVGRGHGYTSQLTAGLSTWSEFPELGVMGETLISMNLETPASVLVVQQSHPVSSGSKKFTSNSTKDVFGNKGVTAFVNHRKSVDGF